jgi:hypothetical protein
VRPSKALAPFLSTRYWWTGRRSVASNVARLAGHSEEATRAESADSGDDLEISRKDEKVDIMAVKDKTKYAIIHNAAWTDDGFYHIVARFILKKHAVAYLKERVPNQKTRRFEYQIMLLTEDRYDK